MREILIPIVCSAVISIVVGFVGWVLNKIWTSFERESKWQNTQLDAIEKMMHNVRERLVRIETRLGISHPNDAE